MWIFDLNRELKAQFNDLTEMFSQDQNQKIFRDILMRVSFEIILIFFLLYNLNPINQQNASLHSIFSNI